MMILERNAKLFAGAVVLATIAIGCSTASDEGKVTFSMSRNDSQTYSFPAGAVFEPSEFPNWRAIAEERFRLANSFEAKASEPQSKTSERDLMTAADLYIAAARFGNTGAVDRLKTGIKSEAWTYHSQEISDGEVFDATATLDHGVYFLNEKAIVRNRAPFQGEILVKDPKSKGVVRLRSGMSIKEVKAAAGARGVKFNPISPDALAIASTTLRFEANRLSQLELGKLTLSQAEKGATARAYWEARKRKKPNASGDGAYRAAMGLLKSDERQDKLLAVTLLERAAEFGLAEAQYQLALELEWRIEPNDRFSPLRWCWAAHTNGHPGATARLRAGIPVPAGSFGGLEKGKADEFFIKATYEEGRARLVGETLVWRGAFDGTISVTNPLTERKL